MLFRSGQGGELNAVTSSGGNIGASGLAASIKASAPRSQKAQEAEPKFCSIDDPNCDSCQ